MLKKTSWLLFGRIVSDGLSFIFYITLARTYGEAGIGDYSFAFAMAALFSLGVEFGFRPLITRNVARKPELVAKYRSNLVAVQAGLAIAIGMGLYVFSMFAAYSSQVYFLLILAFIGMSLRAIGLSFVAILEAMEAMDKSAILEVVARLAIVALGFTLVLAGARLQTVMISQVVGGIAYLGLAMYWVRQQFGPLTFKIDPGFIRTTLYAAMPFVGVSILYEVYARVDLIMLHHFIGEAETGQYAVAVRFVTTPLVLAFLIGVAMYPTLSRGSGRDSAEGKALFLSTLKWLGILGMAGAVMLITIGDRVVVVLFGQEFAGSGELVRWMAILFFIGFVRVPYDRLLLATNRERTQLRIQGLSVGLNLTANLFLIPKWGAFGAVWASILSELVLLVALHLSCVRLVTARYTTIASRLLLAGGSGLAIGILAREFAPWPIIAGLVIIVFTGAAVAIRVITVKDRRRLSTALKASSLKTISGVEG
jgi:O-antigen/teichoic acid export membrane protein